jgi:hypothetical protein
MFVRQSRWFLPLFLVLGVAVGRAPAQGAGSLKFLGQSLKTLEGMIREAGEDGYRFSKNGPGLAAGWLKQDKGNWVTFTTVTLRKGKQYLIVGAGDKDTKDLDVRVMDSSGEKVAQDTKRDPTARVELRRGLQGRFAIQVRLYQSRNDLPCVCTVAILEK